MNTTSNVRCLSTLHCRKQPSAPEPRHGQLRRRDAQLVAQLPHGRVLDAGHGAASDVRGRVHLRRVLPVQRVAAARVGPHTGEGHLSKCSGLRVRFAKICACLEQTKARQLA
jgi:hypothetical protein